MKMARNNSFLIKKRDISSLNKIHPIDNIHLQQNFNGSFVNEYENNEKYECKVCRYNMYSHSFVNINETDGVIYYHTIVLEIMKHKNHEIDEYLDHVCGVITSNPTKWIWIMDFSGFSSFCMMRNKILTRILDLIHDNYGSNMEQMIILYPSWHIKLGSVLFKKNIAQHVKDKIIFDYNDMFNNIIKIELQANINV